MAKYTKVQRQIKEKQRQNNVQEEDIFCLKDKAKYAQHTAPAKASKNLRNKKNDPGASIATIMTGGATTWRSAETLDLAKNPISPKLNYNNKTLLLILVS